jgi:hypothetical protein
MAVISVRDGQVFLSNATEISNLTEIIETLNIEDLADVTISSVQQGDVLIYDSLAGEWQNQAISAVVTEVDGGSY